MTPRSAPDEAPAGASAPADRVRQGTIFGFLAYGIWGIFPLYFHALKPAGAWEILAHRIVWTMLLCMILLAVRRDWAWLRRTLADRRLTIGLVAAAFLNQAGIVGAALVAEDGLRQTPAVAQAKRGSASSRKTRAKA